MPIEDFLKGNFLDRADIVLARRRNSFFALLVTIFTRTYWAHAALIFLVPYRWRDFQSTYLIESTFGGVDLTDFAGFFKRKKRYVIAIKRFEAPWFSEAYRGAVRARMLDHIEADYDYWRLVSIVRAYWKRAVFQVLGLVQGHKRTVRAYYTRNRRLPNQFICSGFVQFGYLQTVRDLIKAGRIEHGSIEEVLFASDSSRSVDEKHLLSVTPQDLANAPQLVWKFAIVDDQVYRVRSQAEVRQLAKQKPSKS